MEDENEDSVKVMTAHSAKGLEFPVVFIISAEEEVFPHLKSMELEAEGRDPFAVEEERRLFYVAMTRAEKLLFISFAKQKTQGGEGQLKQIIPSRFLYEIPDNLYDFTSVEKARNGNRIELRKNRKII